MSKIQFIQVSPTELATIINEQLIANIETIIKDLNNNKTEGKEFISRKETAEFFGVSLVSIHDWVNKGIIKKYKIGNKTLFKRSELVDVLLSSNKSA
ncbi:hypothetical protein DNU06_02585 [Putridiphycobacter roseus]|uniref:Helix-turn-helix domain-containing protein n=1 Tax=Putridiphycobacter roseus TaxID=2219161 RepID=A0A2W1N4J0_9FLAO|nr:helix-turn-helix domain-containing protein [Putridiphycobacter roseus]PZE18734.1 hypothetical protein DNU06_02585 [Putridiphycobacter roseus]